MRGDTSRLDNFTDAAFAFALSLLVIGGGDLPSTGEELRSALADLPIFAIGFALLGMFWYGHVRWRNYRGPGGSLSVVLTFTLVFILLIYIRPLQAMAASFATFLGGSGTRFRGDLGEMFTIYGAGFSAMCLVMALLFWEAHHHARDEGARAGTKGETIIWLIMAGTGLVSVLLSQSRATAPLAPFVYATLPISIPLFSLRYRWAGRQARELGAEAT